MIMEKITKKSIRVLTTVRSLRGVYPNLLHNPYDREFRCEINGDVYVSDNRRQDCRDDGVEQGTIIMNGTPINGFHGWDKTHFIESLYQYLNKDNKPIK